ncbi:MAG: hypothetical protein GY722_01665 [bacterium]|nr:hypothetical protein [bacterium]
MARQSKAQRSAEKAREAEERRRRQAKQRTLITAGGIVAAELTEFEVQPGCAISGA